MSDRNEALDKLRDELNRTGVISDDEFKRFILGWVNAACKWAYDAGVERGRKLERAEELVHEDRTHASWGGE